MRILRTHARGTRGRLVAAPLLSASLVAASGTVSLARPSHQDLEAAKARLDSLNRRLDQLVEQYNQARLQLQQAERDLEDARDAAGRARADADAARALLS